MRRIRQSLPIWTSLLSRSSVFYLALFLVPVFWLTFFVAASLEKTRALNISESQANNSLLIYQANINSIFLDVDRSLLLLRLLYEKDAGHFDLKYWTNSAGLTSTTVTAFSISAADGFMIASSTNYGGPPLYFGDRDDFVALKKCKRRYPAHIGGAERPSFRGCGHQSDATLARPRRSVCRGDHCFNRPECHGEVL